MKRPIHICRFMLQDMIGNMRRNFYLFSLLLQCTLLVYYSDYYYVLLYSVK